MKDKKYKSIAEVSQLLGINKHVIRYWDSQFEGVSTRLGERKRRIFNPKNIKKLQILKKLLHTDGKSHHSLEMARMIIEGSVFEKKINLSRKENNKKTDINTLVDVSNNLKKLLK